MASDVDDLTTFYADLSSIFENDSSSSIEPSYNTIVTDVNTEGSYHPTFGSFFSANSDPLSGAAFVASSSPLSEVVTTQERLMADYDLNERSISSSIQTTPSVPVEDDMDEDDFDGIPIRHANTMVKKNLNGDSDLISNHSKHDHLLDELVRRIEHIHDDNVNIDDIDDESFLNGFTDEQHDTTITVPTLFKDIPDIDDPNEPEEDDDENIPFDHMDMFDQSDSIRSSSPDSLLSSSHLDDDDDDVAQWNDDIILDTTSSKETYQNTPSAILQIPPDEQVDFIDSSRSDSPHLSIGYADQAHIFINDDGLVTSSDDDGDDMITVDRDELCLQVNLDDHRSRSSSIPDQSKTRQITPNAAIDDDLQKFIFSQPTLRSDRINEKRKNDIVHDIIDIKYLFNEYNNDDEFIAVMHNPNIFEQVLCDEKVISNNNIDHLFFRTLINVTLLKVKNKTNINS
jgi:hypothetical protein